MDNATIERILQRKWNHFRRRFHFMPEREEFYRLFEDFKDFIRSVPELSATINLLITEKKIPKDFCELSSETRSWNNTSSMFSQKQREDFYLLEKVYTSLLNDIDARNSVTSQDKSKSTFFDADKSRLYVHGVEIKIRKFSDQYHILRVIFEKGEDTSKEWFFSELVEKIDPDAVEKRHYNAAYQVGIKAKAAGIVDLFITTRQSLKINPKYMS